MKKYNRKYFKFHEKYLKFSKMNMNNDIFECINDLILHIMKCRVRLFLTEMHDQIRFKLWKNMIKNFSNSLRLRNGKYFKIYEKSFEE